MRMPIIAGNWKLFNTVREAQELVENIHGLIGRIHDREVVVLPVFTSLYPVAKLLEDKSIKLGAQDLFFEEKGAYTGEVAPLMLKDVGCSYVLIGHSERRKYFGETDVIVNRKVKAAIEAGLIPIICVGESLQDKEFGMTIDVVSRQTAGALKDLLASEIEKVVIAYEPIWAIGTGKSDNPSSAQQTISGIRNIIASMTGDESANKVRILYGGSVIPENIDAYMKERDIDGALVGRASLTAESFARIVKFEQK